MDEIDMWKALEDYYALEYYNCMDFPEFLDRYGHFYKKTTTDKV